MIHVDARRAWLVTSLLVMASGCASTHAHPSTAIVSAVATPVVAPDAQPAALSEPVMAPAINPVPASSSIEAYQIQPEDILQLSVYQEPDLTTRSRVSSSGQITVPLVGDVPVAGLTIGQVQERLTQLFGADYLVNPQVQVNIESYHASTVFVTGAVNKPGSYPIPTGRPMTVMEALAMAGGFKDEASVNATRIIRTDGGEKRTIEVKVSDIIKKGDKTKDVAVRPNDIIFVPESFF